MENISTNNSLRYKNKKYFTISLFAILLSVLLFFISINFNIIGNFTDVLSIILLILNIYFIYIFKDNIYMLFLTIPLFYANYSICIGEFLIKNFQVTINDIRLYHYDYFYDVLIMIFIYTLVMILFVKKKNIIVWHLDYQDNIVIYILLFFLILLINVFFFNRASSDSYIVRGTPIQGYTYILFIFLNYYSGNKPLRRLLNTILALIVSLQVLMYGGRGSVIPIIVVLICMLYINKLNFRKIIIYSIIGVIILTFVGAFRSNESISFTYVINKFLNSFFVQDTSVMAFISSTTHIAASAYYGTGFKIKSLFSFILAIVLGGNTNITQLSNVTAIASKLNLNLGGGIIVTHFNFWLGWAGVVLAGIITAIFINKGVNAKTQLGKLIFISFIASTTSWYLYSPLQMFRILFIVPIIYWILKIFDSMTKKLMPV